MIAKIGHHQNYEPQMKYVAIWQLLGCSKSHHQTVSRSAADNTSRTVGALAKTYRYSGTNRHRSELFPRQLVARSHPASSSSRPTRQQAKTKCPFCLSETAATKKRLAPNLCFGKPEKICSRYTIASCSLHGSTLHLSWHVFFANTFPLR